MPNFILLPRAAEALKIPFIASGGMADGRSLSACKLGRSFPIYTGGVDVLEAIAAAEKAFLHTEGRRPTVSERGELAEKIGRPFYMESGGYSHASGTDVIAWVNRERDQVKQAVAGFDFTFSPVKSVSVWWALADENTASHIAALHHEAVAEALAWAEDNAIYTRVGTGGIKQVKTGGIIASEFTHFDTRGGDPDLHSHVLIANKVQAPDGRWLSLDGRAIFQMHQAISSRYDAILHDKLTRRMGVEFQAHYPHPDKAPIWEIAGIDRTLTLLQGAGLELDFGGAAVRLVPSVTTVSIIPSICRAVSSETTAGSVS